MDLGAIISWLILGLLSGSLVGRLFMGRKEGFGFIMNLILGCAGALLGFIVQQIFNVDFGIDIQITFTQLILALLGTVVVILIWKVVDKKKKKPAA